MARRKSEINSDLPPHLRLERGESYWRYSHPEYVKKHGRPKFFSAERSKAIALAASANLRYESEREESNFDSASAHQKAGPRSASSFSAVADSYYQYWLHEAYEDEARRPKPGSQANTRNRLKKSKEFFGDLPMNAIDTVKMRDFYDTIKSAHEYNKIKSLMTAIFEHARSAGLFHQQYVNPGSSARRKRVPKSTQRRSMEPHQYNAIYELAPEWLQIAMDICLQTSLRQNDLWQLRWDDIESDVLYVIDNKSKTNKRNDRRASYLKFDLKKNAELRKAINRARMLKMRMQGKREAFRDCPFIIINADVRRVNFDTKTKEHALQVTKREANKALQKIRDQILSKKDGTFYDWSAAEMPAFHGIRKLSLQTLEDQSTDLESLKNRAGHRDVEMTKDIYLDRNHPAWHDATLNAVDLKMWRQGEHKIDRLLKKSTE